MEIRFRFATSDREPLALLDSLLASAVELTSLHVTVNDAATQEALLARANAGADDVIVPGRLMSRPLPHLPPR